MKKINIDFSGTYGCNFRCNYCLLKDGDSHYAPEIMSDEVVDASSDFIEHVIHDNEDAVITLFFYGGEPLLYPNVIYKIIGKFHGKIWYHLVTNGFLIEKYYQDILNWMELSENHLRVRISFDYFLQDKNRKENTHDLILENIIKIGKIQPEMKTITVFPYADLIYFDKVLVGVAKLMKQVPNLHATYNIDRTDTTKTPDVQLMRDSFSRSRKFIDSNPSLYTNILTYNAGCSVRSPDSDAFYGDLYYGIAPNGDVSPNYEVFHVPPVIRQKYLYMGNVLTDSYDSIHGVLLHFCKTFNLDPLEPCLRCMEQGMKCRAFPWRTVKNDISEFNRLPEGDHCFIHKLLLEYDLL